MKGKWKKIVSGVVLMIGVLFLVAGNYFYDQGIKRGTEVELHSESTQVNAEASEQDQELVEEAKTWFSEQSLEELTLDAYDGLILKADYLENGTPSDKTVVLAHGFRQTREDMGKYAKMYVDEGYNVLLPDARGHGESEGNYIGFGWDDRKDYVDWIDKLIQEFNPEEIVLHGHSMGAATVLMTSGEELPEEVKAIIADSSYSTVKGELAHQLKHIYKLPAFPLLEVTSLVTKVRAGWTFEEADILSQVQKNTRPVFLIHGDADDLVPTAMADDLYEELDSEKELWIVPGAGHTKAFENNAAEFQDKISTFLSGHVSH